MKIIKKLLSPLNKGFQNAITVAAVAILLGVCIFLYIKAKDWYQKKYYEVAFGHPEVINLVDEYVLKIDTLQSTRQELDNNIKLVQRLRSDSTLQMDIQSQHQSLIRDLSRRVASYRKAAPCSLVTIKKRLIGPDIINLVEIPCDSLQLYINKL